MNIEKHYIEGNGQKILIKLADNQEVLKQLLPFERCFFCKESSPNKVKRVVQIYGLVENPEQRNFAWICDKCFVFRGSAT